LHTNGTPNEKENYRNHYFEWFIKSTSKAVEGLYSFDHLGRLRDIQIEKLEGKKGQKSVFDYRKFGPLGKAFVTSTKESPSVLLIDEIDKADIDFPNDLLLEIDQQRFFIEETGEEIIAEYPPLIIITSNDEKELPNAFLRRCVFHYIEFPDEELLLKIVKGRSEAFLNELESFDFEKDDIKPLNKETLAEITQKFKLLFDRMRKNPSTRKIPSTSELIDWLKVIHYKFLKGELSFNDNGEFVKSELMFPEVLLKSLDDQKTGKSEWKR
jgi:MoxR-like ATPase